MMVCCHPNSSVCFFRWKQLSCKLFLRVVLRCCVSYWSWGWSKDTMYRDFCGGQDVRVLVKQQFSIILTSLRPLGPLAMARPTWLCRKWMDFMVGVKFPQNKDLPWEKSVSGWCSVSPSPKPCGCWERAARAARSRRRVAGSYGLLSLVPRWHLFTSVWGPLPCSCEAGPQAVEHSYSIDCLQWTVWVGMTQRNPRWKIWKLQILSSLVSQRTNWGTVKESDRSALTALKV